MMAKAEMTVLRVAEESMGQSGPAEQGETAAGGGTHQDQACIDPTTGFMGTGVGPTEVQTAEDGCSSSESLADAAVGGGGVRERLRMGGRPGRDGRDGWQGKRVGSFW